MVQLCSLTKGTEMYPWGTTPVTRGALPQWQFSTFISEGVGCRQRCPASARHNSLCVYSVQWVVEKHIQSAWQLTQTGAAHVQSLPSFWPLSPSYYSLSPWEPNILLAVCYSVRGSAMCESKNKKDILPLLTFCLRDRFTCKRCRNHSTAVVFKWCGWWFC